jgi:hypothetical protein
MSNQVWTQDDFLEGLICGSDALDMRRLAKLRSDQKLDISLVVALEPMPTDRSKPGQFAFQGSLDATFWPIRTWT